MAASPKVPMIEAGAGAGAGEGAGAGREERIASESVRASESGETEKQDAEGRKD